MITPFRLALGLALLSASLAANEPEPVNPAPGERLPRAEVEKLVGPIALYPDPLVALILPAATRPSDIVLAARFLERGGDPAATQGEPWEDSVKALAHYREAVAFLDENLAWTRSLGDAFLAQPDDVMNSIQTLRRRARDGGLLVDTAEQEVVLEDSEIRIVPARTAVIHIPRYDPEVLHVERVYYDPSPRGPFLTFSVGYGVGSWLCYDPDWRYPSVRIVHRPAQWYRDPSWRWRHAHRYTPSPAHPPRRWSPPSRRFDRPRHHAPRPSHYVHQPRREDPWARHARLNAAATRDGERDRTSPRGGRSFDRRPERSQREPFRPADAPPTFTVDPVIPPVTPTPMLPAASGNETRRADRGDRTPRNNRFDHSDRPDRGERDGPPRERRSRQNFNPPPVSSSSVAAPAPSFSLPPSTPPRREAGPSRRDHDARPDRAERAERRARADEDRGRDREAR